MHSLVSLLCNRNATENTEIEAQMFKGDEQWTLLLMNI